MKENKCDKCKTGSLCFKCEFKDFQVCVVCGDFTNKGKEIDTDKWHCSKHIPA